MKDVQAGLCVIAAVMLIFAIILHFQGSDKSSFVSLLSGSIAFLSAGIGFISSINNNKF